MSMSDDLPAEAPLNTSPDDPAPPGRPRPWLALLVVFGAQLLISFVAGIAPILAADMAPQLGVSAEKLGNFTALSYLAAIVGGLLVAPWIGWLGPIRSMQIMLLAAGAAALLAALGSLAGVVLAALALGTSLGFPHPAFTAILSRHAPRQSIGLFLSLRFAAAPVGLALAALILPAAAAAIGARWTIAAVSVACALAALAVGRAVPVLDWRVGKPPRRIELTSAVREVIGHPEMRRLALVSMAYAMVQQGFLTYAVLLLVGRGLALSTASTLLAMSQLISVVARIAMGHASDRWISPRAMLVVYGVSMGLACAALTRLPHSPSVLLAGSALGLVAATAMGWPGLATAQLLRLAPPARIARCSSGNQVFMFSGAVLGPWMLATLLTHGVDYSIAFIGLGALAIVAGVSMAVSLKSAS
jgi:MFS family permease